MSVAKRHRNAGLRGKRAIGVAVAPFAVFAVLALRYLIPLSDPTSLNAEGSIGGVAEFIALVIIGLPAVLISGVVAVGMSRKAMAEGGDRRGLMGLQVSLGQPIVIVSSIK